jgi:hypothetical protein
MMIANAALKGPLFHVTADVQLRDVSVERVKERPFRAALRSLHSKPGFSPVEPG